jgi:hypothetical protein
VAWRSGPWDRAMLDRLRIEVQAYFRSYYEELRRLVAEFDNSADMPEWFRGGRIITTSACTDGGVIAHKPYEVETRPYPERPDSYRFHRPVEHGYSVGELVRERLRPAFPDGSRLEVMPEYAPGADFGAYVRLGPARMFSHYLPNGDEVYVNSDWTRLDAASMSYLGLWRDTTRARVQAWEALRPYVEG